MTSRRSSSRVRQAAALALAVALSAACSTGSDGAQGLRPALQARRDVGAAHGYPFENLSELLGNHLYKVGDKPAAPLTAAVVTGRFLSLEPGRGFTVAGSDAPDGTPVDFDSPDALWRTMHGRFAVDHVITGHHPGWEVTVGLSFGAETAVEPVEQDLLGLEQVVLFLQRSPVFGYDPAVYGVVLDGGLIAPVDDAGQLTLPILEQAEASRLLNGAASLEALQSMASEPPRTITLDATGTEKRDG